MKAFKITLKIVCNNRKVDDEAISDMVFELLKSSTDKLALCNITSIDKKSSEFKISLTAIYSSVDISKETIVNGIDNKANEYDMKSCIVSSIKNINKEENVNKEIKKIKEALEQ